MYQRNILPEMQAALADTPVLLLNGARQTGKTTLAMDWARRAGSEYISLDDATALAAAARDPRGFLKGLGPAAVIDEVQKVPALFPAIKLLVDADRMPGRFLLTGSANVQMLPKVSESLAGRMEILTLWPLSQGEIRGHREVFLDAVLQRKPLPPYRGQGTDFTSTVTIGGYPEAVARTTGKRRDAWFNAYITAILQRDIRDLAHIEGLTELPLLLALLAARSSALLNRAELSRSAGMPLSTLNRYLSLLETTFLVQPLPPWHTNLSKRLIKAPKIHLADTGLATHLIGHRPERLAADPSLFGHLLESFVVGELRKQAGWSEAAVHIHHYRTNTGREVDAVLESGSAGAVTGIEVKAAASVNSNDFNGLRSLAEAARSRFVRGIVLYAGDRTVAFADNLLAMPVDALWQLGTNRTHAG